MKKWRADMPEIKKDLLDDLFNIPRNGSNIVDDDESDVSLGTSDSRVPFSEKAKQIADKISKVASTPVVAQKETQQVAEKINVETAIKKVAADKSGFDSIFDDVIAPEAPKIEKPIEAPPVASLHLRSAQSPTALEKSVVAKPEPKVVAAPEVSLQAKLEVVKMPPNIEAEKVVKTVSIEPEKTINTSKEDEPKVLKTETLFLNGHSWKLTSPADKYDSFYAEKKSLLTVYLLKDGEIPFEKYYTELGDANVDVNVPTYDTEEVGRRITEVMQWRDRIKHIQLHTNAQYFVWKQYMDILPGVMARIEYERGKQEGILYEHMSDMYGYYGSLDGLHKSCEMVSKHLDAAYASLSRQVAIAQPMQEVERFNNTQRTVPMNDRLQKFDGVSKQTTSSGGAGGRQKEAAKAAEPKSTSVWERL
jgi:hypothetical protein